MQFQKSKGQDVGSQTQVDELSGITVESISIKSPLGELCACTYFCVPHPIQVIFLLRDMILNSYSHFLYKRFIYDPPQTRKYIERALKVTALSLQNLLHQMQTPDVMTDVDIK